MNKSFIFGIASTLAVVALAGGGYWLGQSSVKDDGSKSSSMVQSAEAASVAEVKVNDNQNARPNVQSIKDVINAVMNEQYGKSSYKANLGCWDFTSEADVSWCLKPVKHKQVGKVLYFFATSDEIAAMPDAGYTYGLNDSGLLGVFAVELNGKDYDYIASSKNLEFGSTGSCGCNNTSFLPINPQQEYGLMFSSGIMNQGVISSFHHIIVPINNSFKDVSAIPEITEDNQDILYKIHFSVDNTQNGFYPIVIEKTRDNQIIGSRLVYFDLKTQLFDFPKDF